MSILITGKRLPLVFGLIVVLLSGCKLATKVLDQFPEIVTEASLRNTFLYDRPNDYTPEALSRAPADVRARRERELVQWAYLYAIATGNYDSAVKKVLPLVRKHASDKVLRMYLDLKSEGRLQAPTHFDGRLTNPIDLNLDGKEKKSFVIEVQLFQKLPPDISFETPLSFHDVWVLGDGGEWQVIPGPFLTWKAE